LGEVKFRLVKRLRLKAKQKVLAEQLSLDLSPSST